MRESRKTSATSSDLPFRTTSCTAGATRSMKVSAPASADWNRTVVTDGYVPPSCAPLRSSSISYESTVSSFARC